MSKPFSPLGSINNAMSAACMPWLKKYGLVPDPTRIDLSKPNAYQNYGDAADGTTMFPTFIETNAANQFEINIGHAVVDNAFTVAAVAVPATPTAVVNGTAGATTYTYAVVGRGGNLQAPSATVSVTTGNATLSAVNSVGLTWTPTPGLRFYDVYRTVGGATQGLIGTVQGAYNSSNVTTPTLTFTDIGIKADGSTAPTTNTTGAVTGDLSIYGNVNVLALATPHAPLVTVVGTAGSTTWAYKIVAKTPSGHTAASGAGSTAAGIATMTAASYNTLLWQPVPGASSYDVYRTTAGTSPSTTGLIGTTTGNTFSDTALAGDSGTAPTTNTTGGLSSAGGGSVVNQVANYIATESGSNNAIAGTLTGAVLAAGLVITVKLAHSLQAGANTFTLNSGSPVSIKSHFASATDIGTAYVSTGVIQLFYNGTVWQDLSQ